MPVSAAVADFEGSAVIQKTGKLKNSKNLASHRPCTRTKKAVTPRVQKKKTLDSFFPSSWVGNKKLPPDFFFARSWRVQKKDMHGTRSLPYYKCTKLVLGLKRKTFAAAASARI